MAPPRLSHHNGLVGWEEGNFLTLGNEPVTLFMKYEVLVSVLLVSVPAASAGAPGLRRLSGLYFPENTVNSFQPLYSLNRILEKEKAIR